MPWLGQNPQGIVLLWILIRIWDFPSVFPSSRARSSWLCRVRLRGPSSTPCEEISFVSPPPLFLGVCAVVRGKHCDSACSMMSIRNASLAKWTCSACWCAMKRFLLALHSAATCFAFQCQVGTTASDVGRCCSHVCHAVRQQHSPCPSSVPGGQQAA